MKWVIVSDNHNMKNILTDIVSVHEDADLFIHLGDSEFDYHDPELKRYIKVAGNCDFGSQFESSKQIQMQHINAFITHGHLYQVGRNRERIAEAAALENCNIAFYGHTHIKRVETIEGVVCINPGSIAQSRSADTETYAVFTVEKENQIITFYNQQHEIVDKEIVLL
ncbi:metallophosphoesterase family protein [Macrococcus armenti]|uniref:Phosphoesterase n=1 Tax=Macrococcus armenti TaxID=2875764 RepID=A0ABY3ZTK9_9STAP|nr:metallophosphoesterase [Macrococcus armenti]UOB19852.1 metallophosphoesterase [Macrococcus armenti]